MFDRRLDGARIEETVDGGAVSRQPPAITVTWPDSETVMSAPPFAVEAFYNSAPPRSAPFGVGTTDVFVRPHAIGLPSATTVSFVLDKTALTSVYGEPIEAPDEIPVAIDPLSVLAAGGEQRRALDGAGQLHAAGLLQQPPGRPRRAAAVHARVGG